MHENYCRQLAMQWQVESDQVPTYVQGTHSHVAIQQIEVFPSNRLKSFHINANLALNMKVRFTKDTSNRSSPKHILNTRAFKERLHAQQKLVAAAHSHVNYLKDDYSGAPVACTVVGFVYSQGFTRQEISTAGLPK